MTKQEKFPYELPLGAAVDFADGRFMLVIKDDEWNDEQLKLAKAFDVHFCYTADLAIFVVEGGPVDSSDFYFNIQECDEKDALLNAECLNVELLLVNEASDICLKKSATLNREASAAIQELLKQQNQTEFMPGEFDVNAEGIQSAYEPFELNKFSKAQFVLK
ncbi:MAG: hypothetical protein HUJ54_05450 [Erysipelotrichaceae bacterium]|nr:hypothetical protein [Erysipelotrichaceae bacterium]